MEGRLSISGVVTVDRKVLSPLTAADEALALSMVESRPKRVGRRRRCVTCGEMYGRDELNPEFDEEGRRIGWICDGCY